MNPTVNCACKGSRLCASHESLKPDGLIKHYGVLYNYFIIWHNVIMTEIKCIINVMCLNHPHPLPLSVEKLSSMKPVLGAKNIGDRCTIEPRVSI